MFTSGIKLIKNAEFVTYGALRGAFRNERCVTNLAQGTDLASLIATIQASDNWGRNLPGMVTL